MTDITSFAELVLVPITVAIITASSSIFAVIKSNKKNAAKFRQEADTFREENTAQHNDNKTLLSHLSNQITGIDGKVDRLDQRLDDVQIWQKDHENLHSETKEQNI